MNKQSTIFIVGHDDIIENTLYNYFVENNYEKVYSSSKLGMNPTIQPSVYDFFSEQKPEYIFLSSTMSGGIKANQEFGGDFIYHNLESQNNVIYAANKFGARKLMYLASSCIYPKECAQPMKTKSLLTGPLEETSEPYAVAKIAGIKLCQSYRKQYGFNAIVAIPPTVYGLSSDLDQATAHVFGALLSKFMDAVKEGKEEVNVWGTGKARREFLFQEDFLEACLFLMENYDK